MKRLFLSLAFSMLAVSAAQSHENHGKPQFGGIVALQKDLEFELVVKPGVATLHVMDHGKPIALDGASAKLTVLSGTTKTDLPMTVTGNRFEAKGDAAHAKGTKAVATVVLPKKGTITARFEVK